MRVRREEQRRDKVRWDVKDTMVLQGCYREEGIVTRENRAVPESGFVVL